MTTDQALCLYAQRRDAQAFRLLVDSYQRLVYSAARRRLAHSHDVDDVVQITFLKLAQAASSLQHDSRTLASWLYTTALNAASELIRRDQTRRRHESLGRWGTQAAAGGGTETITASATSAPSQTHSSLELDQHEFHELSLLIDQAILELPPDDQSLLLEHFFQNRSQRDLARTHRTSQSTIKRRLHSAVDALRQKLTALGYPATSAAMLPVALKKIVLTDAPAALTKELTKIGLAGKGATAATTAAAKSTASVFALSAGAKIAIASVATVAISAAVATQLPSTRTAPPLPSAAPRAEKDLPPEQFTPPRASAEDRNAALAALAPLYKLDNGQNLRRILPPFSPERDRALTAFIRPDPNSTNESLGFVWSDGQLLASLVTTESPNLLVPGTLVIPLKWYNLEHRDSIHWTPPRSDWVIRDKLSLADAMDALAPFIAQDLGKPFHFEHHVVRRPCIVIDGPTHANPEPVLGPGAGRRGFASKPSIALVTPDPIPEGERELWLNHEKKASPLGHEYTSQLLDAPLFHDGTPITLRDSRLAATIFYMPTLLHLDHTAKDYPQTMQKILANLQSQLGATWTLEDRDIDTWEPVEK